MKRLIFLVTFIIASFPLIAAESLESGMQDLATQIVTNSKANNKQSIAVAPFPHSDGTYSELSNYLVDELVLKLFTVPGSNLEIMERTQLSTVFEELNISLVGAISPDSIKELGKLHGVDALVIGSITKLGERIRIIARLTDTETGKLFSAAGTTIPKTATISELMSNIIQREILVQTSPSSGDVSTSEQPTDGQTFQTPTRPSESSAKQSKSIAMAKAFAASAVVLADKAGKKENYSNTNIGIAAVKTLIGEYNLLIRKIKSLFHEYPFAQALQEVSEQGYAPTMAGMVSGLSKGMEIFMTTFSASEAIKTSASSLAERAGKEIYPHTNAGIAAVKTLIGEYNVLVQETKLIYKEDPFAQSLETVKYKGPAPAESGKIAGLAKELEMVMSAYFN